MPLVAMIADAMANVGKVTPQVSTVFLTAATIAEAEAATFIFCNPEVVLSDIGRKFLQSAGKYIQAVFIDEFHIVATW